MKALLGWIGGAALPYVLGGLAVVLAGGAVTFFAQHHTITALRVENAATALSLAQAQDANTTNLATIGTLKLTNADWAKKCAVDPMAAQEAIGRLMAEKVESDRQLAAEKAKRKVIYANDPTSAAWGSVPLPAALVRELRAEAGSPD